MDHLKVALPFFLARLFGVGSSKLRLGLFSKPDIGSDYAIKVRARRLSTCRKYM